MKKSNLRYIMISILAIIVLFGLESSREYFNSLMRRTFTPSLMGFLLNLSLSMLFGLIISLPQEFNRRDSFNWPKFLIQGIPAFVLTIPINMLVMVIMSKLNIHTLYLGPFNDVFIFLNRNYGIHALAGVWFGKVLADCLWQEGTKNYETGLNR